MNDRDIEKIVRLAKEGKSIARIWADEFPEYPYWEIYSVAYNAGVRPAQGTKRMITSRLKKLASSDPQEQERMIDEIDSLVRDLYYRYMDNQQKLEEIRKLLDKKD